MTPSEFREYLARFGRELGFALHGAGPLAGLPVELEDAFEVANGLRMLDQPAPTPDELRHWYRSSGAAVPAAPTSPALQAYETLDGLRESDLAALDENQLLLLVVRLSNWTTLARRLLAFRRAAYFEVGRPPLPEAGPSR